MSHGVRAAQALARGADRFGVALRDLAEKGWHRRTGARRKLFDDLASELGLVISRADVRPLADSRKLVFSDEELSCHTDHPKADFVAWFCASGDRRGGGQSLLADAKKSYLAMSGRSRKILASIEVFSHRMFDGDEGSYPLASDADSKLSFCFADWLLPEGMSERQALAVEEFRRSLGQHTVEVSLRDNDLLVVDNHYMLHGRRQIKDRSRHLVRYWISRRADA